MHNQGNSYPFELHSRGKNLGKARILQDEDDVDLSSKVKTLYLTLKASGRKILSLLSFSAVKEESS